MRQNIVIKDMASYHPKDVLDNSFFLDHFRKMDNDITDLLQCLGKERRYISTIKEETVVTMGIEACRRVLKKTGLEGKDIDMLVFSSGTAEYVSPATAIIIHKEIQGKNDCIAYDLNASCVGMVVAIEQASRYMLSNPKVNRALIVGSDQMFRYARREDAVTYANFGEASSAVILEKTENTESGFIDSAFYTNSRSAYEIMLPACGFSKLIEDNLPEYDRRYMWEANASNGFSSTVDTIQKLLQDNGLTTDDIKVYCFSQLSKGNTQKICEGLNENFHKFYFIGDEYGYTGSSSPLIVFEKAIENGRVQKGDYLMFWSLGAGSTACTMLYKY